MKPAKNLVQKVARQVAQEPIEILKEVQGQTIGTSTPSQEQVGEPQKKEVTPGEKAKMEAQGASQLQALEKEMEDIRVLKEQKEVQEPKKEEAPKPLVEPATKRSRRLFGWGAKLKQLKAQTETRIPSSS